MIEVVAKYSDHVAIFCFQVAKVVMDDDSVRDELKISNCQFRRQ